MGLGVRFHLVAATAILLVSVSSGWCVSSDSLLRNQVGDTFFAQGDFEAAVREYREAVRLSPDYARARYNLATVLDLKLNRGPEALEHYRAYLSLTPIPLQIVLQRIQVIQDGLDYTSLMGHITIEGAESYLADHPQGTHFAEVKDLLSRLIDNRRKEEEAVREQQRRELAALGEPNAVERWAWLWKTWEIRWFQGAGTALVFSEGKLKRKVSFPPFDRQDAAKETSIRKGIIDGFSAERVPVVIVTPARMTTSGLLDHIYLSIRERFRAEGVYLPLSASFDRSIKELIDKTSALEPSEFLYVKKNDITGVETKVPMPGYRATCDIGSLPLVPVGAIVVPPGSRITRIKVSDEVINVFPGQSIQLAADRYRIELWAGNIMARTEVTLEAQQTVTLADPQ
jgi:hypothetical protein